MEAAQISADKIFTIHTRNEHELLAGSGPSWLLLSEFGSETVFDVFEKKK
jgi:hypothetical protein